MARVFVGNLPTDVQESALEAEFDRFGRIRSIALKFPQRPPPFAFIVRLSFPLPLALCRAKAHRPPHHHLRTQEFEDERDASDAVRAMHGYGRLRRGPRRTGVAV